MIACISGDDGFQVLCWDEGPVIRLTPPDPHENGWEDYQDAYDAFWKLFPKAHLIGVEKWYLHVTDALKKEFVVHYFHTGKFEADYRVRAKSQDEADEYVLRHHSELDPENVIPLCDDYERYL